MAQYGPATVASVNTGSTDRGAWIRRWTIALAREYVRRGYVPEDGWRFALAHVAHLVREAGWGRSEFDRNPGNIKCFGRPSGTVPGWRGDCQTLHDGLTYRAYPSDEDAAADYVGKMLGSLYGRAFAILRDQGDPLRWYRELMLSGYHPWSQQAETEYVRIYPTVVTAAGSMPDDLAPPVTSRRWMALGVGVAIGGAALAAWQWWR